MRGALIGGLVVLGLVGGFAALPTAPVAHYYSKTPEEAASSQKTGWAAYRGDPKPGIRIAVEGRLKWLGLI